MILLNDLSAQLNLPDSEEHRILSNVPWLQYQTLLAELGNTSYRVYYLNGVLEIVAPSRRHESSKTRIGDLLLLYFLETNTEYFPMGSTTLGQQQAGGEPDESYCIGSDKAVPDLAIEVIITSGGINRLALYQRLGVQEVWFWQNDSFALYHQHPDGIAQYPDTFGYEPMMSSKLLPELDIALLTACVHNPSPLAAAKAFRQHLQANAP
ncbi:MAG: Uma2 family endonuclease [Elainellaceae cyanobacterium]